LLLLVLPAPLPRPVRAGGREGFSNEVFDALPALLPFSSSSLESSERSTAETLLRGLFVVLLELLLVIYFLAGEKDFFEEEKDFDDDDDDDDDDEEEEEEVDETDTFALVDDEDRVDSRETVRFLFATGLGVSGTCTLGFLERDNRAEEEGLCGSLPLLPVCCLVFGGVEEEEEEEEEEDEEAEEEEALASC
jgi:hypothetical protein